MTQGGTRTHDLANCLPCSNQLSYRVTLKLRGWVRVLKAELPGISSPHLKKVMYGPANPAINCKGSRGFLLPSSSFRIKKPIYKRLLAGKASTANPYSSLTGRSQTLTRACKSGPARRAPTTVMTMMQVWVLRSYQRGLPMRHFVMVANSHCRYSCG